MEIACILITLDNELIWKRKVNQTIKLDHLLNVFKIPLIKGTFLIIKNDNIIQEFTDILFLI